MRGKSHISLGYYLIDRYLSHVPRRYQRAFLLGCIEPDRNPATYLKGSVRFQWLRGHNYLNAQQFMQRIAARLEKKEFIEVREDPEDRRRKLVYILRPSRRSSLTTWTTRFVCKTTSWTICSASLPSPSALPKA